MKPKKKRKKKKRFVLWFTGLPCSGKTTLAKKLEKVLKEKKIRVLRLDGDTFRKVFSQDLGFSEKERRENIKRVACIIQCFKDINFIASFISPYKDQREELKKKIDGFIEVFLNCPLEVCQRRDKKGMYKKACLGKIKNFTGLSDVYEKPENPQIELNTANLPIKKCLEVILKYLKTNNFI